MTTVKTLRRVFVLLLVTGLSPALPATGWEIAPDAAPEDFAALHRRLSGAAYAYPRHGAKPLGITGFELFVDSAVDLDFDDQPFAATALDGDLPLGALAVARVGVRKGLPGGFDLGASYGRALGGELDLLSAELQWALVEGGAVAPALGLRLTGTRSVDAGAYELEQIGVEALLSKGFAVVTPYVGAGVVVSESRLERPAGGALTEETTRAVVYAGVTLRLLLPKLTFELERAEHTQAAVRLAFGF